MNLSNEELKKEKIWLDETTRLIRSKISKLGQQLYDKEEKIQEFQKFIWDSRHDMDPTEMRSMIATNDIEVNMALRKGNYFQKLFRIQNNPYFGAITFKSGDNSDKIYIGITHVEDDEKYYVHDWRAPISSMFYDYGVGNAEYESPSGKISGEITNKRQFKIEQGNLIRVFDNSINIDDDMLQEVLSTSSNEKMKNIVNTIQQEQNLIIRNTEDRNLIVQGIAGSGKTSVALHRIAFLLYKIENLKSNNILIFSPNQIFSEYISNVLPELGEDNTMQTTFHDFLKTFINEYKEVESFTSFVERFYKYEELNPLLVKYKQSDEIINDLNKYITDFVNNIEFVNDLLTHDFDIAKDELNYLLKDRYSKFNLLDRINSIAERICRDYYKGKKHKFMSVRALLIKNLNYKFDYKDIYKNFFYSKYFINGYNGEISNNEINKITRSKTINYEDACLFVYIKGLLEGFEYKGLIKEVVIDEAQDYSKLQYIIIKNIFKKSSFTILGDINQTINPYYKYNSLKVLCELFGDSKYLELTKTYRSSQEIIEYTNKILNLNYVSAIRKANKREVLLRNEKENLKEQLIMDINMLLHDKFSIAIITKNDNEAKKIYELLKDEYEYLRLLNSNTVDFDKRLVIVPVYIAKGLEFDASIIYTNIDDKYTSDEKYLYYVACTRTQHQLIVYNQ
mgnify:FL=1